MLINYAGQFDDLPTQPRSQVLLSSLSTVAGERDFAWAGHMSPRIWEISNLWQVGGVVQSCPLYGKGRRETLGKRWHPNLMCWIVNVGRSDACTASRVSWFAKQASYPGQISRSFPDHVGTKWRSHKSDICWYRCTGWQSQGEFLRCKRSEFYAWTTCFKKYPPLVFALNFYFRRLDARSCLVLK